MRISCLVSGSSPKSSLISEEEGRSSQISEDCLVLALREGPKNSEHKIPAD